MIILINDWETKSNIDIQTIKEKKKDSRRPRMVDKCPML